MKNIAKKTYCLLLMLTFSTVLLITGCSSHNNNQYKNDFDLLWDELENSYPYFTYIDENIIDVDELRTRYTLELDSVQDVNDFANLLQRMFSEMNNLAHLDVLSQDMYQEYYYLYVLNKISSNDYTTPYSEVLQDDRIAEIYTKPTSIEAFEGEEISNQEVYIQYYSDQKAIYFKIPSFSHELKERDEKVISDAIEKYAEVENVIFDITGNSGGSDYYWMDNIVAPFGGSYELNIRNFFKTSSTTDKYINNVESCPINRLKNAPEWANSLGLDKSFVSTFNVPNEPTDNMIIPATIKRWVLTGPKVYSASDKFAYFCKSTGWATLVGAQTGGDGLGSTPILIILPDSGLLIRFSCTAGENTDGSMNAILGTTPDVLTIKNETALERCLKLITDDSSK
ncbi:Peptidase family S41 [Pseudobutyrivibrio sp. UC1225]|uniref:S41 family peptidase n=1 Tax=Pseudobutyrivibrio sp. UC1225 TaxID=1798185 RepID=UPI0008EAF8CD|nr:S41 family peptidase [Pseudobutyrivibrio sp. UC1225]SFO33037.1 Peptidase family S41 [Pseudobutyrivibrio sp. UC1225]